QAIQFRMDVRGVDRTARAEDRICGVDRKAYEVAVGRKLGSKPVVQWEVVIVPRAEQYFRGSQRTGAQEHHWRLNALVLPAVTPIFVSYAVAGLSLGNVQHFDERHQSNTRIRVQQQAIVNRLVQSVSGRRQATEYTAPLPFAMSMSLLAVCRGLMVGVFGVFNDRQVQRLPRYLNSKVRRHFGRRVPQRPAPVKH